KTKPAKLVQLHHSSVGPGHQEEVRLVGREISYQNHYVVNPTWETTTLSEKDYQELQSHFNKYKVWEYEGSYDNNDEAIDINSDYLGGSLEGSGGARLTYEFVFLSGGVDPKLAFP